MATREENLKKINDELEKLNDEELDAVAGRSMYETSLDASFLYGLNGSCGLYSAEQVINGNHDDEIVAAWKSVGILAVLHSGTKCFTGKCIRTYAGKPNLYMIMPEKLGEDAFKPVSRAEAMQYAMEYVKSHS